MDEQISPALKAALYGGASAAIAALTLHVNGDSVEALEPLKGLTPTQLWCAHGELLAVASEALTALSGHTGEPVQKMVADLGLGLAVRFG